MYYLGGVLGSNGWKSDEMIWMEVSIEYNKYIRSRNEENRLENLDKGVKTPKQLRDKLLKAKSALQIISKPGDEISNQEGDRQTAVKLFDKIQNMHGHDASCTRTNSKYDNCYCRTAI
jgi:hypothetical protein